MNVQLIYLLLYAILFLSCQGKHQGTSDLLPYVVQDALTSPAEFAGGTITTMNGICFSNDGRTLFTSGLLEDTLTNGRALAGIYQRQFLDSTWSEPELIDFGMDAYHPVLSVDNSRLFFNSRSHPDSMDVSIPHNIWFSEKTESGWSTPQMVPVINSENYDSYPSVARNNNIYFNSDRKGGKGGMDFYVSRFTDGKYQEPEKLEALNSIHAENDLVVDPDEQFIIFNRYIDSTRQVDLFISFFENEEWGEPKAINSLNTDKWELTPTLSPEGRYFFYELDSRIMQVDLEVVLTD